MFNNEIKPFCVIHITVFVGFGGIFVWTNFMSFRHRHVEVYWFLIATSMNFLCQLLYIVFAF